MRRLRFFVEDELTTGSELRLDNALSRRLTQVLRLKSGAELSLFNGNGLEYEARLLDAKHSGCLVLVGPALDPEPAPLLDIHLGLGLSKGERLDFALQKTTELGLGRFTPLRCQHQALRLDQAQLAKKEAHWRGILISASEQSGRHLLPRLLPVLEIKDWLRQEPEALRLLLDPEADLSLDQIPAPRVGQPIRLLVGPEGGLSAEEIQFARAQGFVGIRLGPRVLRTETAPLAALAAMQMLWGDFGSHSQVVESE